MRAFLDTNVLVYLFDADNPTRRDQAAALLARQQEDLDLAPSRRRALLAPDCKARGQRRAVL